MDKEDLFKEAEKHRYGNAYKNFIRGTEWQKNKMYSEEDLREAFRQGHKSSRKLGSYNEITEQEDYNKWFLKFKNK